MRTFLNAALVVVLILCALVAFVVPFWVLGWGPDRDRGALSSYGSIDGRSGLLRIVFDPHANDLGTFQARELSFLRLP